MTQRINKIKLDKRTLTALAIFAVVTITLCVLTLRSGDFRFLIFGAGAFVEIGLAAVTLLIPNNLGIWRIVVLIIALFAPIAIAANVAGLRLFVFVVIAYWFTAAIIHSRKTEINTDNNNTESTKSNMRDLILGKDFNNPNILQFLAGMLILIILAAIIPIALYYISIKIARISGFSSENIILVLGIILGVLGLLALWKMNNWIKR